MSLLKERILEFIDYKGISKNRFYNLTGISRSVLDKSTGLSEENISKYIATFPEVNSHWLLTGEGEMLTNGKKKQLKKTDEPSENRKNGIPLIPIEAMAGWTRGEEQIMDYDATNYVVPDFEDMQVDYMIRVKGSSMYPKYSSGDLLACRKITDNTFFQWNKVYVMDTVQGAIIKRLHPGEEEDSVKCVSDNKEYLPFDVKKEEINSLAIVVGVIRLE